MISRVTRRSVGVRPSKISDLRRQTGTTLINLLGPALGEIGGAGAVSRLRQPDPNRSAVRSGDGSSEPIERDLRVPFRRRHAKHAQPEERGYEVTDGIEVGALASPAAGERKVRRLLADRYLSAVWNS